MQIYPFCSQYTSHIVQAQQLQNNIILSKFSIAHLYCRSGKNKRTREIYNCGGVLLSCDNLANLHRWILTKQVNNLVLVKVLFQFDFHSPLISKFPLSWRQIFVLHQFLGSLQISREYEQPCRVWWLLSLNLWYIKSSEFLKFGQQVPPAVIPDFHKLLSLLLNPQLPLLGNAPLGDKDLMSSHYGQLGALPQLPLATLLTSFPIVSAKEIFSFEG